MDSTAFSSKDFSSSNAHGNGTHKWSVWVPASFSAASDIEWFVYVLPTLIVGGLAPRSRPLGPSEVFGQLLSPATSSAFSKALPQSQRE